MKMLAGILGFIVFIGLIIALSYGFGWLGVHQTKTIGKAMKNAEREVYEESQSYVEGKRQEALKIFLEFKKDPTSKTTLCSVVVQSFANFDVKKLHNPARDFVESCM